jgi:transcriptional regulator with XRE-family HTH domain
VSDTPATFGQRVRALREDLGMTRGDLAERIHVTTTALSQWEIDRTHPHFEMYARIADALGSSLDYLMAGKSER